MCRAVKCRACGKVTWSGCGQHVDQVLRSVAKADRCDGHEDEGQARGLMEWARRGRP